RHPALLLHRRSRGRIRPARAGRAAFRQPPAQGFRARGGGCGRCDQSLLPDQGPRQAAALPEHAPRLQGHVANERGHLDLLRGVGDDRGRRLGIIGGVAELAASKLMEWRLGKLVGSVYHEGEAGKYTRLATASTLAGTALMALAGRRREGAAAAGTLLLTGSLCKRFAVY